MRIVRTPLCGRLPVNVRLIVAPGAVAVTPKERTPPASPVPGSKLCGERSPLLRHFPTVSAPIAFAGNFPDQVAIEHEPVNPPLPYCRYLIHFTSGCRDSNRAASNLPTRQEGQHQSFHGCHQLSRWRFR